MEIKARPVMNVAVAGKGLIPFMYLEITEGGVTKKVLANYSFGEVIAEEGMNERVLQYESRIGELKERMFNAIQPRRFVGVFFLEETTVGGIESHILDLLQKAKDGDRILFVWPRHEGVDDVPWYQALGLAEGGVVKEIEHLPVPLSELGLKVDPPFIELPANAFIGAPIVRGKGGKR